MKFNTKNILAEGAEAKIYVDNGMIIKHRIKKKYRNAILDEKLRDSRTKREAKMLEKLHYCGFTPSLITIENNDTLIIEKIDGEKLRDSFNAENYQLFAKIIGKQIREMHNLGIIHGDLTTSNMIVKKNESKIYFIDFGLSFFSNKIEDKAVDLHLLKQTLESKHYLIAKKCFSLILKEYDDIEVANRLRKVEERGRNKGS